LNLFPLPPLDGSGVLTYFMTHEGTAKYQHYARRFSLLGLIIVWHIFWPIFSPIFAAAVSMLYPGVKYS
jgi:Zn-dependent protease